MHGIIKLCNQKDKKKKNKTLINYDKEEIELYIKVLYNL